MWRLWTASSSIGKQSGALRSSKLIAEKIGAILFYLIFLIPFNYSY